MPRYRYSCNICNDIATIYHPYNVEPGGCERCRGNSCMERLYNEAFSINKNKKNKDKEIGTVTKQHIEENREILKDMREEARSETHEPT